MNPKILFFLLCLIACEISAQSSITLLEPTNGAKGVRLFPVFKWTRESNPMGYYEIQISATPDFSVVGTHGGALANPYISPCTLLPSTQYFWRVRLREAQVYGNWSSEFSFTTRDTVINLNTTLLLPANNSEQNILNPIDFKWNKNAACTYALIISKDKSFPLPGQISILTGSTPSHTLPPQLELNTTYYWRVCAVSPSGPWSETYSFNTVAASPSVQQPAPVPPPSTPPAQQPIHRQSQQAFSFPNPFAHVVTINFQLNAPGLVQFEISDSQGSKIDRFNKSFSEKGWQAVEWRAISAQPGNYFCKIVTGEKTEIVKLLLTR